MDVTMLKDIHIAIQQLLYTYARVDSLEVEVRFDTPSEEWVNSLMIPTVSFFLFDIRENTEKRETNLQMTRDAVKGYRRLPPRRIDLVYLASIFCTEVEDEHQLLWRLLATLMKHQHFPEDTLPESLKSLDPGIVTRLEAPQDGRNLVEIWNALGLEPHPALCYVVTAPLDLDIALEAPLVLTRTARYGKWDKNSELKNADQEHIQIGGVVRDKSGTPLPHVTVKRDAGHESVITNAEGRYILHGVPAGSVVLTVLAQGRTKRQVKVQVPSDSYDIVLEK